MSIEPFRKLVKLTARAFYDDISTKGDSTPKSSRGDNRGMAVVILDALTRCQWVREEDLAKDLKIHLKQLRRTLRFFEEEKLVMRDHRKETAKGVKIHAAAVAATADSQHPTREGGEKIKLHTHSYCCLDYAQIYDVVRYRLHRMKKKIKDELDSKIIIQEYICPNCNKRYTALDAARLVSMDDEYFHCESCNGELVAESDKLAAQEIGNTDDNARRLRREKLKEMFHKMEEQLKPLAEQLSKIKDLPVPEFGTLQAWEVRARAGACAAGEGNSSDPSRSTEAGTPMPFLGDTKVEVLLSGVQAKVDSKSETTKELVKIMPPWMIKQGMILSKEQRGEVKEVYGNSVPGGSDDKKSNVEENAQAIVDEFRLCYAAAVLQRQQQEQEAVQKQEELSYVPSSGKGLSSDRQVGLKSKRENEDADDLEWEEAVPTGNVGEICKANNLNVQVDTAIEDAADNDDDIEWEEG